MRISTIAYRKNGIVFSSPLVVVESDPYASSIEEKERLEGLDVMLKPVFVVLRPEILKRNENEKIGKLEEKVRKVKRYGKARLVLGTLKIEATLARSYLPAGTRYC